MKQGKKMRIAVIIFLLFSNTLAHAKLFRYVDPATGSTIFSNMPIQKKESEPNAKERSSFNKHSSSRSGAAFPSVSLQTQRFRDMDRRKILQEELDIEKKTLGMVMANGAAADTVHRHRMNVDALEREIRNVK